MFGIDDYFKAKAQKSAEEDARRLANEYSKADYASRQQIEKDLIASGWNPAGINQLRSMASESSQKSGTSTTTGKRRYVAFDPQLDQALGNILKTRLAQPQLLSAAERAAVLERIAQGVRGQEAAAGNVLARRGVGGAEAAQMARLASGGGSGEYTQAEAMLADKQRELEAQSRAEAEGYSRARAGENTKSTTNFSEMGSSTRSGMNEVGPDIGALAALRAPAQQVSMKTGISPFGSGVGGLLQGAATIAPMFMSGGAFNPSSGSQSLNRGLQDYFDPMKNTLIPRMW